MSEANSEAREYQWNPRIACRTLEDTAFILHESKMVSLNEVGTFIWEQFKKPRAKSAVVDAVENEFDAPRADIAKDVDVFVESLLERALLVHKSGTSES